MCRAAIILFLAVAIVGAAFLRVRSFVGLRGHTRTVDASPRDVGAALRQISGVDPSPPKPWLVDELAFKNQHAEHRWIIGRSGRPATCESEAVESARADAARQLYPVVCARLNVWPADRRWLRDRVARDVSNGGEFESDALIERFDRPYGTVYAGAVLLDVSGRHLDRMVRDESIALRDRHRRVAFHMMLGGTLIAMTWLGYAVLNALTRGYAVTRLQVIGGLVTAAVLLLV